MFKKSLLILVALALLAAACGDDDSATDGPSVQITSSGLGEILADTDGKTLYLFVPDNQGASVCNDDCADAWPPVLGTVAAGDGVNGELLGTAARQDGSEQATYNGWPLYYFAADAAPGDTNGQGVNDVWYVVSAGGEAIQ